jgi:hypothetical protein
MTDSRHKVIYRMFDADDREVVLHNTEDKDWWLKEGEIREREFLQLCAEKNILKGISINPERTGTRNKALPEFFYQGALLDLKDHRTPFFEAQRVRDIPPRYALTLDEQDVIDIETKYPACRFVFYVNWIAVKYQKIVLDEKGCETILREIAIQPLHGIWGMTPARMRELVTDKTIHEYLRRKDDRRGNAKTSFGVDLRRLTQIWVDPASPPIEAIRKVIGK